jgi:hypothetical protein
MSRALFLSIGEGEAIAQCLKRKVAVSTIERLPGGGIRLVCASNEGAGILRAALSSKLMEADAVREPHRPKGPLW